MANLEEPYERVLSDDGEKRALAQALATGEGAAELEGAAGGAWCKDMFGMLHFTSCFWSESRSALCWLSE